MQELLTNVVKYAQVSEASLLLGLDDSSLIVEVADDGRGFDTDQLSWVTGAEHGFGLFSIRERLRSFGGEMTVRSSPGTGTRVRLALPMEV